MPNIIAESLKNLDVQKYLLFGLWVMDGVTASLNVLAQPRVQT
jgi:hypothetical protein